MSRRGWKLAALGIGALGIGALGIGALGIGALGFVALALAAPGAAQAGDAQAGDAKQGEKSFRRFCSACHATTPGVTRLGPTLHGVIGRESGAVEGFSYSAAYADGRVVWTPDVLAEYLKDPKGYMPGSRMNFPGIRNDAERADVVAYLETLR